MGSWMGPDRWTAGQWVDEWTEGRVAWWVDRWVEGHIDNGMNRQVDRWGGVLSVPVLICWSPCSWTERAQETFLNIAFLGLPWTTASWLGLVREKELLLF